MQKQILKKGNSGITLIALVITIIVLLILAGVVIASLTGENGILKRAGEASENTKRAAFVEEVQLALLDSEAQLNEAETEAERTSRILGVLKKYFKIDNGITALNNLSYPLEAQNNYGGASIGTFTKDDLITIGAVNDNKKTPILSLSATSGTLRAAERARITVTYNGDGELSVESSNSNLEASLNGNILTIHAPWEVGWNYESTITVSASETSEYAAPRPCQCVVYVVEQTCCFDPDSQVLMADGTTKNIELIEEGETVMSLNEDTGEFIPQRVKKTITKHNSDDLVYVNLSNGTQIGMRAYHPLLTTEGYKSLRPEVAETTMEVGEKVELLEVGDILVGYDENVTIESIEYRDEIPNYDTYNLQIDGYHNYIVEGIVAHNAPCNTERVSDW